ncbi:transmembrane protein, putative [Medicago truncatula]|uniref:Transmembrane protein, putative n=1 Tax=Medicago truncatula TaxID=3880 RepID=A0A072TT66_MEDTR|nr:transmembrane protein, putative [Medicago truncatula]
MARKRSSAIVYECNVGWNLGIRRALEFTILMYYNINKFLVSLWKNWDSRVLAGSYYSNVGVFVCGSFSIPPVIAALRKLRMILSEDDEFLAA